jgi:hypothetical protein
MTLQKEIRLQLQLNKLKFKITDKLEMLETLEIDLPEIRM